jgi:hypothetical protein
MREEIRSLADQRFEAALRESGARDPREYYRELLKELRESDTPAYRKAVDHFDSKLIPSVASQDGDPIGEWMEYGRFLATLKAPGETVQIDPSGRSRPYSPPVPLDHLVLHLPASTRDRALTIGIPPRLSSPQRAAFELLVQGKIS